MSTTYSIAHLHEKRKHIEKHFRSVGFETSRGSLGRQSNLSTTYCHLFWTESSKGDPVKMEDTGTKECLFAAEIQGLWSTGVLNLNLYVLPVVHVPERHLKIAASTPSFTQTSSALCGAMGSFQELRVAEATISRAKTVYEYLTHAGTCMLSPRVYLCGGLQG